MNRGSAARCPVRWQRVFSFNEAPIHESGKSAGSSREPPGTTGLQ